jgi:hypothetical protein
MREEEPWKYISVTGGACALYVKLQRNIAICLELSWDWIISRNYNFEMAQRRATSDRNGGEVANPSNTATTIVGRQPPQVAVPTKVKTGAFLFIPGANPSLGY